MNPIVIQRAELETAIRSHVPDDVVPSLMEMIEADAIPHPTLEEIASYLTTDEGDRENTEDYFGLEVSEVVSMAHDNMILAARNAIGQDD